MQNEPEAWFILEFALGISSLPGLPWFTSYTFLAPKGSKILPKGFVFATVPIPETQNDPVES